MSDEKIYDFEEVPFFVPNKQVSQSSVAHVAYHIVTRNHTNELNFNRFYLII